MAYTSFQVVFFDRTFHEVVVQRRLCHLFVVLDRLVVVSLQGSQIRDLEKQLVRQTRACVSVGSL